MKPSLILSQLGLAAMLSADCVSTNRGVCIIRPSEASDLMGSWIGYDEACLFFYRVTLADNNQGLCVTLFTDDTPDVHHIKRWSLKESGLVLELVPATSGTQPITMEVVAFDNNAMRVTVKEFGSTAVLHALLHREDDVLRRTKQAEKIAGERKWQGGAN